MDIKITGTKGYIVESLLPYLKKKFVHDTVSAISVRNKELDLVGTDVLIHVAGLVPGRTKDNSEYYRVNYELTVELAELAKKAGVRHFIYFSTIAVYGRSPSFHGKLGFQEGTEKPVTPYGDSKLMAEKALKKLESEHFKIAILRVPDVYGNQNIDYLQRYINIANKYRRFVRLNPMIWTDNKRCAVHIDNLNSCVYKIIETKWSGRMIPHDETPLSTHEYICLISEINKLELHSSRWFGVLIYLLNIISGKFVFFYGSFDVKDELDVKFSYHILNAEQACKKSLEEHNERLRIDECEDF